MQYTHWGRWVPETAHPQSKPLTMRAVYGLLLLGGRSDGGAL